ncbi:MAG: hypothetical protein R3F56_09125 [Planctomycetota bacterium]
MIDWDRIEARIHDGKADADLSHLLLGEMDRARRYRLACWILAVTLVVALLGLALGAVWYSNEVADYQRIIRELTQAH